MPDEDTDPATLVYTFGGVNPVASIKPGMALSTWTFDAYAGRVRSTSDRVSEVCVPALFNPQTGPFYVEGAQPGDTLALHFVSIAPRYTSAASDTPPFFGALTGTDQTAMLHPPLPERTWIYDLDTGRGIARYRALDSTFEVELPLDPMHGTVGVAPAFGEVRSSLAAGNWGGNMDTPEMRAGVTCYIGVNVEGALFSIGDGHARQGEGEACGLGIECAMNTVLIVDLIKSEFTPWLRIETDDHWITTGSARPLEDAFRISQLELVRWIAEMTQLSELDAYQLVSQVVLSPVGNVVDTGYTMLAKFPKTVLSSAQAFGGIHQKLREQARLWHAQ